MYHSVLIHSFTDGHLGCFQHLAIVSFAAMNIGVHRFFWIGVSGFLGYNPSSGIAGSKGNSITSFLRKFHTVFHSGCSSLQSCQQSNKQVLERLWRKGIPRALLVALQTGAYGVENSLEFSQKTENGTAF